MAQACRWIDEVSTRKDRRDAMSNELKVGASVIVERIIPQDDYADDRRLFDWQKKEVNFHSRFVGRTGVVVSISGGQSVPVLVRFPVGETHGNRFWAGELRVL